MIAALILAGAAICRPDINLRRDLDHSLYSARDDYILRCRNGNIDPVTGTVLGPTLRASFFYLAIISVAFILSLSTLYIAFEKIINQSEFTSSYPFLATGFFGLALSAYILLHTRIKPIRMLLELLRVITTPLTPPVYETIVKSYYKLKIPSDGVLARKIKQLLEDDSKTLKVGVGLYKLKISSLVSANKTHFREGKITTPAPKPIEGNYLKKRSTFGPENILLDAIKFDCVKRQETSNDEIFWIGFTSQIANLKDVYDEIDNALTTRGSLEGLELKAEWSTNFWK